MRERPNRTVSKTVVLKGTVGSNPTLSATPGHSLLILLPCVRLRLGVPPPLVVYSPPRIQGSLWATQEARMFEQTEAALVMTLLALGGIALMADEKLGSTCLQMVKWIRTRGRH